MALPLKGMMAKLGRATYWMLDSAGHDHLIVVTPGTAQALGDRSPRAVLRGFI
jgi:hypothetical protein